MGQKFGVIENSSGFTLLEVMIALAIVGSGMIALLTLGTQSIKTHDRIQNITKGMLLAQKTMSTIEVQAREGSTPDLSGAAYEEPFENFRWQGVTEDTPLPLIKLITVSVHWGEGEDEQVELTSFLPN